MDAVDAVAGHLQTVSGQLQTIEERLNRDAVNRDRHQWWTRTLVIASCVLNVLTVVVVVVIIVGVLSYKHDQAVKKREAAVQLMSERIAFCKHENAKERTTNAADKAVWRVKIQAENAGQPSTPQSRQRLSNLFAHIDALVDQAHPLRDCSPKGIAAFVKNGER